MVPDAREQRPMCGAPPSTREQRAGVVERGVCEIGLKSRGNEKPDLGWAY
jgi:hypothetical protein